jgi:serine/threonine protein kinase
MADRTQGQRLLDPFEGTAYRTVQRLCAGEMSELFVVEHLQIGRRFAAKALHAHVSHTPQVVDRLRLEGQALARLSHPNVVSVEGFDTTRDGRPFLIMELLRGRSLAQELAERGAFPMPKALAFATQLLSALEAVHQIGVVHRDVSPANVFIAEAHGGRSHVKLLDFGIARVVADAPPEAPRPLSIPTDSGTVLGTPRYLSPEGAGGGTVDERGDVYGAALVLYAMLAGRGPFDHLRGDDALLRAHAQMAPDPVSRHAREPIPAELDAILLRALDKDPNARFGSAREFRLELERLSALYVSPLVALDPPPSGARDVKSDRVSVAPRPARKLSPKVLALAVVVALAGFSASALAVVGIGTWLRGGSTSHGR